MTMTGKDYQAIATAIHDIVAGGDRTGTEMSAIRMVAGSIADHLEVSGGFDLNGNRRFKRDRFMAATGVEEGSR